MSLSLEQSDIKNGNSVALGPPSGQHAHNHDLSGASVGIGTLAATIGSLAVNTSGFSVGIGTLAAGIGTLAATVGSLSVGVGSLAVGIGTLAAGIGTLAVDVGTLSVGIGTLAVGIGTLAVTSSASGTISTTVGTNGKPAAVYMQGWFRI